ncbi:unnamed protein product [Bursaphelenchus xylophilus]|uniref:(pine wood nematode) hypothetical protein n=1 Tax=Bursaphelenchus xylophilus TaxID=6326 RepID=A0A7I8X063_BURXY|nr:unnamed protein product [Bursaphelenchus xylophilus]CAG9129804.1 unnamed protein product [Bursaphelenchus xylophilus]
MMFFIQCCLLFPLLRTVQGVQPIVILPSVISWDAPNEIIVTSFRQIRPVDVTVTVASGFESTVERVYNQQSGRPIKVEVTPTQKSQVYNVSVRVSEHDLFETSLIGTTSLKNVIIQTDKMIYRTSEEVIIRALPITKDGQIYKGIVQYHLENPSGFRIMKKLEKSTGRFVSFNFTLPAFGKFGKWRIIAMAESSNQVLGSTSIQLKEYVLAKFFVTLDAWPSGDTDSPVTVAVGARFAHGKPMNGNLVLKCTRLGELDNTHSLQIVAKGEVS